ncbi:MAG: hypothetical protein LC754_16030 [Acidobacteria bacterium]|nr:hypothetical protein [Acidobacteriota bacterium]
MKFKLMFLLCVSLSLTAASIKAQTGRGEGVYVKTQEADADPVAGVGKRLGQLKAQLKELRAKPRALKPGEAVGLNPQPEPPGKERSKKLNSKSDEVSLNPQPEPPGSQASMLRQMRASLSTIRANLNRLSLATDASAKFKTRLDEALTALEHYEKAGDRKAANASLDDFSHALDSLSKMSEKLGQ